MDESECACERKLIQINFIEYKIMFANAREQKKWKLMQEKAS